MKAATTWISWGRRLSILLACAGVGFVAHRIWGYADQIPWHRYGLFHAVVLAALTLVYAMANGLLARAWWHLLRHCRVETRWRWALRVFGVTQINKYIPGNVFHLAGRQALGMASGLPAKPLGWSAAWELGLLVALGVIFSGMVWPAALDQPSPVWASLPSLLLIAAVGAVLHVKKHSALAEAWFAQAGFLTISAIIFVGLIGLTESGGQALSADKWGVLIGAYVMAWLAGLLTPGAPAGIGVREAVLLMLLGSSFATEDLLLAVLTGRFVTAAGDFLFYVWALLSPKHNVHSLV